MRKFGPENFDFPIVGSKIKVVVESSVTYQNLLAENSGKIFFYYYSIIL